MKYFLFLLWTFSLLGTSQEEIWKNGLISYEQGEKETTHEGRQTAFNQALSLFYQLKEQLSLHSKRSPSLNAAIADTFFQFQEYPWAVLYYYKAIDSGFEESLVFSRLQQAEKELGLSQTLVVSEGSTLHFLHMLSQNVFVFFLAFAFVFLTLSGVIWIRAKWIRNLGVFSILIFCCLLGNWLYFYYSASLDGVLIKTTGLYRSPGWKEPQLTKEPLFAGSKVHILQMMPGKTWVKIRSSGGTVAYIPVDHVRAIHE